MADARQFPDQAAAIDDAAAAWYGRHDGGLTAGEKAEFQRWLEADARHAGAWRDYEAALGPLDALRAGGAGELAATELTARARRRRWRTFAGCGTGLAAAAALALAFLGPREPVSSPAEIVAALPVVAKPERRTLPDGSLVELNRGAEIEVTYGPARRGVRLVRGEAHFAVEKDAARPFVVSVQGVEVRAVGTAFAVQADSSAVNVVVTEGRVAVARVADAAEPVFASAGSRVTVPVAAAQPSVAELPAAELESQLAWRGPRLELTGTPLGEAVLAFNRENRLQLRVADRELAQLRMSGVFRADNAEGFARMLEANYDVRIERGGDELILRPAR